MSRKRKRRGRATNVSQSSRSEVLASDLSNLTLRTESDVEQKFVKALLSDSAWLHYDDEWIHTKDYLPPTTLDKGARRVHGYYPDYSIWVDGLPVFIVEAKSPNEAVEDGFREASLYAYELNKRYPPDVNPVRYILASNGLRTFYGLWDSEEPLKLTAHDAHPNTKAATELCKFLSKDALQSHVASITAKLTPSHSWRPIEFIGGERRLDTTIPFNSFAHDLFPLIKMFFDSDSPERLDDIIEKAYVTSDEIAQYDHLLEVYLRDQLSHARDPGAEVISVGRKSEPKLTEQIRRYADTFPGQGHLQLLIGPVGSGKSLFIQRYHRYLQPAEQASRVVWSYLDFNSAPDDLSLVETWVCKTFVDGVANANPDLGVYDISMLKRLFAPDINRRDRGPYALLREADPTEYARRLADDLRNWVDDPEKFAASLCRYLIGDAQVPVIVAFDNVDRRDREQQLRIFQVAQWFKNTTRAFCILTLRDETYERYKAEPPLDAFLNSVHFYIRPPRFINVVRKRLELVLEFLLENSDSVNTIVLPNGMTIRYPRTKLGDYLKTLYVDLFHPSRKIGSVLEALTGRNVRSALKMFTDIIISGHLDERGIVSTVEGAKQFGITEAVIIKILMRTGYKYHADDHGYITNILTFSREWLRPNNFLYIECLTFLIRRRKEQGEIGIEGYFLVGGIASDLARLGYVEADVLSALGYLLERGLIQADHMKSRGLRATDFVKIHASGYIHVHILLERLEYLAAICPSTEFFDRKVAERLSALWDIRTGTNDVGIMRKGETVELLAEYMKDSFNKLCDSNAFFDRYSQASQAALRKIDGALGFWNATLQRPREGPDVDWDATGENKIS